jgi:uncharacterized protein with HEPN domain
MPSDRDATEPGPIDIRYHIAVVNEFVAGIPNEVFKNDNMRLDAVVRCLEIISEVSRRLPLALKKQHRSIRWRDMAAAGDIYRHRYKDGQASIVWPMITLSLPSLRIMIVNQLALMADRAQTT